MTFSATLKSCMLLLLMFVSMTGFALLTDYSTRPGPESDVLLRISSDELPGIQSTDGDSPTIILFYHPKCPCTFATIRCLERLSTNFRTQPQIHAFAYRPQDESDTWIDSRSTRVLRNLEDIRIHPDIDGERFRRFGVRVSGHILIYDKNCDLTFSGGITPFRSHEGDCRASQQFVRCANDEIDECTRWPVFGCVVCEHAEENRR